MTAFISFLGALLSSPTVSVATQTPKIKSHGVEKDGDRSQHSNKPTMTKQNSCHHCSGLGYIEIRDCSGEIQLSETCSFCGGTGYLEEDEEELEGDLPEVRSQS